METGHVSPIADRYKRTQKHTMYDVDTVHIILMCSHHMIVGTTAIFERKEFPCPWCGHSQPWVTFEGADKGYRFRCKRGGCNLTRAYRDNLGQCLRTAQAHVRLHGHTVDVWVDGWKADTLRPNLDVLPLGE